MNPDSENSPQPVAGPPVMDVQPPPKPQPAPSLPPTEEFGLDDQPEPAKEAEKPKAAPKIPMQASPHVGVAIVATVVIVVALAAMMVYAYLKTK
ncbi:MAG TPA: hypothetical protein VLG37_05595 [Candidatus Saccharimonadales bacterium]|nr:hypothetical protein [Candidatus Saccharimonadales bacterium]